MPYYDLELFYLHLLHRGGQSIRVNDVPELNQSSVGCWAVDWCLSLSRSSEVLWLLSLAMIVCWS